MVAIGIGLLARASITGVDPRPDIISAETNLNVRLPEHYQELGEPVPQWVIEDQRTRRAIGEVGPLITLAGTLIWGYGDVLMKCLFFKP